MSTAPSINAAARSGCRVRSLHALGCLKLLRAELGIWRQGAVVIGRSNSSASNGLCCSPSIARSLLPMPHPRLGRRVRRADIVAPRSDGRNDQGDWETRRDVIDVGINRIAARAATAISPAMSTSLRPARLPERLPRCRGASGR